MTPLARLVLVRATPRRELVAAMAWLTVPGLIGPLVGPPVGGFITTFFSWHWIFLINVPIGLARHLARRQIPARGRTVRCAAARRTRISCCPASPPPASCSDLSVVSLPALPPIVGIITLGVGVASALLYLRHARRAPFPILDLRLFGNSGFRAAVVGGSIFRIGNGAVPFLLPLMFQLGFGMTPFQSGMLTFASAFGAIGMKFLAKTTLRLGGFRTVLISSALLAAAFIAANGLFTAETPAAVIIAVLIGAGFLRSLFFTSTNALVFADIAGSAGQPGDSDRVRIPADLCRARRGGRRRHPGDPDLAAWRRADAAGFHMGVLDRRGPDHAGDPAVPDHARRCRRIGLGPQATR